MEYGRYNRNNLVFVCKATLISGEGWGVGAGAAVVLGSEGRCLKCVR
jgi:hypothetical protein